MDDQSITYVQLGGVVIALAVAWMSGKHADAIAMAGLTAVFLLRFAIKWSWPRWRREPSVQNSILSVLAISAVGTAVVFLFP
jgi:hypothetical protein